MGYKKDFLYYITEFGAVKRNEGESVSDFSKRFNKMYNKIPTEIKPTEASTKITYANAFDLDFCLLLRERRSTTLSQMQDNALEVESNVLVANRLRGGIDKEKRKQKAEVSTSRTSNIDPKLDELTKMVKSLTIDMSKLKMESRPSTTRNVSFDLPNKQQFRRPNAPQIMLRERRDTEDQKVQPPLQNVIFEYKEEAEGLERGADINCLRDKEGMIYLTQTNI